MAAMDANSTSQTWNCQAPRLRPADFVHSRTLPGCGSIEPAGPCRHNRKELRRHRIEERNDRSPIATMVVLGAIGGFYGVETSSSGFGAVALSTAYGFVGVLIAVPLAFAVNLTRNWRYLFAIRLRLNCRLFCFALPILRAVSIVETTQPVVVYHR
jgi:hypothetical protein